MFDRFSIFFALLALVGTITACGSLDESVNRTVLDSTTEQIQRELMVL